MKNYILQLSLIFVVAVFISQFSIAQKNKAILDSLKKIASSQKDSALVETYNELTWQYRMVDRDKAINYGNLAIATAAKINYKKGIAQAYNDLGIIFFDKENYDSAIALYNHSLEIRKQLKDEKGQAKLYNKIGIVFQKQGLFEKALDNQFKALSLFEKTNDKTGVSYSLNNIGIINQNMGLYKEAIKYQERSIGIKEEMGDKYGLAGSYVNIANNYLNIHDFSKSAFYYQKAINISRALGDKEYLSNALNNYGGQFLATGSVEKAIPLIKESYQLRDSLGDTKGMVSCMNNLAEAYLQKKMYDTAEAILNKALDKGKNAVNCNPEINKVYSSLSKLYEEKGEPGKALSMFKLYASTKDSLYTDELSQKFAEQETRYKTLEKENVIQQQQFALTRKNYFIVGISVLLLLGGLLGYSYYKRYKLRQEKKLQLEIMMQQELSVKAVLQAEENERKRIAVELHDGVGQMMSVARMNLSVFESELNFTSDDQKTNYEKIAGLIDDSCKEIRSISHQMMPNALLRTGLAGAVKDFIDKIDGRILKINLHTEGLNERLDSNVESVLYRVLQECVNNVIKHSGANMLDISLIKDADGIAATIEDNGKGFELKKSNSIDGIGLKNVRARIEYLKGTVEFNTAPGKGTLVAIHVPVV